MLLLQFVVLCSALVNAALVFNYGAFSQTATYSIANQLGFFTAYDLDVVYQQVPNSTAACANILNGAYDLLTWTIDNAVNFRFNSGKNLTVLGQLDQGPGLVLASVLGITNISQLVGKPLTVDSPVSGYAYLLRKVLSSYGLELGADYFFQTVGGTNGRYADLVNGVLANGSMAYATILTYPFTADASTLPATHAPNILATISDTEDPISSSAFTVAQSSLSSCEKSDLIVRFLSAMYAANMYLHSPINKFCATRAIAAQLNITAATAALEYSAATSSTSGEISPDNKFGVNQDGLDNIIAVRKEFGGFSVPANFSFVDGTTPGKGKLIDYELRDEAVNILKWELLATVC